MLKNVVTGLLILVVAVFAFVGYNGYSARRRMTTDEVYGGGASAVAPPPAAIKDVPSEIRDAPPSPVATTQVTHQTSASGGLLARGDGAISTDSLPPQPGDGEKFGSGGRYQLYRQGDMTWRLNVETGDTCILLATDEEWHKERVYRSGCRGRA